MAQFASFLGALGSAHDMHAGSAGLPPTPSTPHADVPLGGGKPEDIQLNPCWPSDRTSISESFSSARTVIVTSESGRRKSCRCCRTVVSTPDQLAWLSTSVRLSYGSG